MNIFEIVALRVQRQLTEGAGGMQVGLGSVQVSQPDAEILIKAALICDDTRKALNHLVSQCIDQDGSLLRPSKEAVEQAQAVLIRP